MRFKKGDRVRALVDWCQVKKGDKYVVDEAVRDKGAWINVKGGPNHYMTSSEIELVDDNWDYDPRKATKPEPLKIEAGKFYKTRDGRKVGPMQNCGDYWRINGDGEGNPGHYTKEGTSAFEGRLPRPDWRAEYDLVSEWTSSCAAAQVDNLRDEYGPFTKAEPAAGNDNGKSKFKVGDRVYDTASADRDEAVVEAVDGDVIAIKWDGGSRGRWKVDDFKLVEPARPAHATSTPAIVCLIKDGQPRPSTEPHVHPSRGHAGDEAARLARKYPGKEFGVYELVDTRQVAVVYDHEWQRIAVCRHTLPWRRDGIAAELLMKQSGVDHDTAIRAVKQFRKAA